MAQHQRERYVRLDHSIASQHSVLAPLSWWLVGSLTGLLLIMIFTTVDRAIRAAVWLYRKARHAGSADTATSSTGAIALDPPLPGGRRRFLEQTAIALSSTSFVASACGLFYGRLDMEITRRRITLTRLPNAFEGFRIALLSHSNDKTGVLYLDGNKHPCYPSPCSPRNTSLCAPPT